MKRLWNQIKTWLLAAYNRLLAISSPRWLFFSLGLIICAFSAIVWAVEWAPALPVSLGVLWAFVEAWNGRRLDWKNYTAYGLGAFVIWAFTLI